MLYERWRQIVRAHPNEVALRDVASGEQWTFAELALATEQAKPAGEKVIYPRGVSADFIFAVLQGWRNGQIVCPLEAEQPAPALPHLPPTGIIHLKTTSATTGMPRSIGFTASQLAADAENIVATMGLR